MKSIKRNQSSQIGPRRLQSKSLLRLQGRQLLLVKLALNLLSLIRYVLSWLRSVTVWSRSNPEFCFGLVLTNHDMNRFQDWWYSTEAGWEYVPVPYLNRILSKTGQHRTTCFCICAIVFFSISLLFYLNDFIWLAIPNLDILMMTTSSLMAINVCV